MYCCSESYVSLQTVGNPNKVFPLLPRQHQWVHLFRSGISTRCKTCAGFIIWERSFVNTLSVSHLYMWTVCEISSSFLMDIAIIMNLYLPWCHSKDGHNLLWGKKKKKISQIVQGIIFQNIFTTDIRYENLSTAVQTNEIPEVTHH